VSDGLPLQIRRTRASSEDGITNFAIGLSVMTWYVALAEMAQLFSPTDLALLCALPMDETRDIVLSGILPPMVPDTVIQGGHFALPLPRL
jgi:hypothetical protein